MYKVIHYFTDLHDGEHAYNVGDVFPRDGVSVTADRIAALASCNNLQKKPLIELVEESVEETEKPKATKKAKKKPAEK